MSIWSKFKIWTKYCTYTYGFENHYFKFNWNKFFLTKTKNTTNIQLLLLTGANETRIYFQNTTLLKITFCQPKVTRNVFKTKITDNSAMNNEWIFKIFGKLFTFLLCQKPCSQVINLAFSQTLNCNSIKIKRVIIAKYLS